MGKFELSSGTFHADKDYSQGLKTTEDHRFYSISTPFSAVANNSKEDLIVQYTVKQEVNQECGGSYVKLLPEGYDAKTFNGESEYAIMFGPDICGADNRIHVIFNHKGKNYLTKKEFPVPRDSKTHLYRLTVHPDQKYSLLIDGDTVVDKVSLEEHWDVYVPRTIADPNDKKPADWVDIKHIEDPTHVKPEGHDDIPRYIADSEAKQPEDWDVEADGEWEAPEIANPDFEEWEAKFIDNPEYKGEWKAAEIPNPEFKEDPELAHYKIGGIGLDLWQVKSGSIFDDIIVTSDAEVADKYLSNWKSNNEKEKEIIAALDAAKEKEEKEKAEAAKAEEEAKKKVEETKEDEKDELDDDEVDEAEAAAAAEEEETKKDAEAEAEAEVVEEKEEVEEPKAEEVKVEVEEIKAEEKTEQPKVEVEEVKEEPKVEAEEVKEETKVEVEEVKEEAKVEVEEAKEEPKVEAEEVKEEIKETKKPKVETKNEEEKESTQHDEL